MSEIALGDIVPLHLTTVTYPDFHPLAGQSGPVFAFLIKHPDGNVLVDTGVGHGNEFIDRMYKPVHSSLEDRLRDAGVGVAGIACVVNGHLHFDHSGQNSLFPRVPIYVQQKEWDLFEAGNHTVDEWVRFAGAEYRRIDGEAEIAAGVRVVPTPGHTAGHQAVVVDTSDGCVVIAGQVPYEAGEFDHVVRTGRLPEQHGGGGDPEVYLASVHRLIEAQPRKVLFTHSDSAWVGPGGIEPPTEAL